MAMTMELSVCGYIQVSTHRSVLIPFGKSTILTLSYVRLKHTGLAPGGRASLYILAKGELSQAPCSPTES